MVGPQRSRFHSRGHKIPSIQHQLRAFVNTLLNPVADKLLVFCVDHRAQRGLWVVGAAHFQRHCLFLKQLDKAVGNALLHHDHRQSHTAHAGAAVGGVDNGIGGAFQVAVLQHQRVVLGLALSLYPLSMGGGTE